MQFKCDRNKKFGKLPNQQGRGNGNGNGRHNQGGRGNGSGNSGGCGGNGGGSNGGSNVPQSNYGTINANSVQQLVELLQATVTSPPDNGASASTQANVVETPNLCSIL